VTKPRVRVSIRSAVPEDKGPILEISRHIWSGHDYIPKVWDDWLKDKNGRVLIATVQGRPVGIAHMFFQTKHDAWLEGVRVHPDYRGLGIAGKLNRKLVDYAASKGATVARLSTDLDNKASRRHLTRTGFKLLQSYPRHTSKRPLTKQSTGLSKVRRYNDTLWKHVKTSEAYRDYKGLYAEGWTWYPLTAQRLRDLVKKGSVLQTKKSSANDQSISIMIPDGEGFSIGYLSGKQDELETFARYLRYLLSRKKTGSRVRILVPTSASVERILRKSGYTKTGTTLVYGKQI
jgi:GNAT superfamily N-acetyltransferase